jgi:basic membrane lipoprotein Med (substrate-binding protein (PBP1-ABC) superfamily)
MKMKKKMVALCLAAICLLAACGGRGGEATTAAVETEAPVVLASTEETTEQTTEAPTEPLTRQATEVKVGMIFYGEEHDDSLLAYSLYQEMVKAASDIEVSEDQILVRYNSREADWTQIEESILACVDEGCQLILGCAREYEAVIAAIAEEYPDVMFACVGSTLYNGVNSGTFNIDVGAAQYLQGALAGLMTETNRAGFVAAKGSSDTLVTQAVNAFAYGVWSTNQEVVVDVAVIGKWFLPGAENHALEYLKDLGCDEIGSYTDGSIGDLAYQWKKYFSVKLNQIIQKEVAGEPWHGDYYSGAVTCDLAVDLPEYVWSALTKWGTVMGEMSEEMTSEEETSAEETSSETSSDDSLPDDTLTEETEAPHEIPDIDIDRNTGYLPNERIHEIHWEE